MSAVAIRAALETALAAMSPTLASAWENMPYTPVVGTPYQRVHLLLADPENPEMGRFTQERGFLQVQLAYPLGDGPGAAATRAELIRDSFYRGLALTASGVTTTIEKTPEIAPARIEEDRYLLTVRIRFFANYVS